MHINFIHFLHFVQGKKCASKSESWACFCFVIQCIQLALFTIVLENKSFLFQNVAAKHQINISISQQVSLVSMFMMYKFTHFLLCVRRKKFKSVHLEQQYCWTAEENLTNRNITEFKNTRDKSISILIGLFEHGIITQLVSTCNNPWAFLSSLRMQVIIWLSAFF